jgi:CRISPR/Cas system-associated endonuclease Cas3-HD
MKIYKEYGSKEKLFEMFQKVSNINLNMLNEDDISNNMSNDQLVIDVFNKLKNGEFNDNITSNATTNDNESTIDVVAKINQDNNNVEYRFKFKVTYNTETDEQVVNVNQTTLIGLIIINNNNQINIDQNTLNNFNSNYSENMFSVVDKYFDAKSE